MGRSVCRASAPGVPREETTQGSWKAENPSVAMQMFMAIYVVALVGKSLPMKERLSSKSLGHCSRPQLKEPALGDFLSILVP